MGGRWLRTGVALAALGGPAAASVDLDAAIGPALAALALSESREALPAVERVHIGAPSPSGATSVCGIVTFEGIGRRPQRFVVLVDAAALRHETLGRVRLEGTPGFEKDWIHLCQMGVS